ncbi:hypothetical protein ACEQPO_28505 [Bacillus sp. SL00103]
MNENRTRWIDEEKEDINCQKQVFLSSVDVANMLNDWYVMMKKRNTGAIQLKEEILQAFDRMEESRRLTLLSIARVPFKDLIEDTASLDHSLFVDENAIVPDDMLSYYFYFL